MVRPRFDATREFVAMRGFTFLGKPHEKGDPFNKEGVDLRKLKTLYDTRNVDFDIGERGAADQPVDPVTIEKSASRWLVKAAWLDEPIRETTKAKAGARADQVRAEGPPPGWIEGGTVVTVEGGEGGWYEVNAPWLEQAEKVQGREAAEARQLELHTEGEPALHHGVTLTPGDNGWWEISANWGPDNIAKVHGEAEARELAAQWRAEGPPADPVTITVGTEPDEFVITVAGSDETEIVIGEEAANARAEEIRAELHKVGAGETDPVTVDPGAVTTEAEGKWVVSAPWLEAPDVVDTEEAANSRADEIRTAGPPEGWEPPAETTE